MIILISVLWWFLNAHITVGGEYTSRDNNHFFEAYKALLREKKGKGSFH